MVGIALLAIVLGGIAASLLSIGAVGRRPFPSRRAQCALLLVAVAAAVAPGVHLLVVPSYSSGATLLEVNGRRTLILLSVPVVLTALPVAIRTAEARTVTCAMLATLLGVLSFLSGFSIGLFYVPAAGVLLAAAVAGLPSPRRA